MLHWWWCCCCCWRSFALFCLEQKRGIKRGIIAHKLTDCQKLNTCRWCLWQPGDKVAATLHKKQQCSKNWIQLQERKWGYFSCFLKATLAFNILVEVGEEFKIPSHPPPPLFLLGFCCWFVLKICCYQIRVLESHQIRVP